jgi:glutathione peroxidase
LIAWSRRTALAGIAAGTAFLASGAKAGDGNAHDFTFTSIDGEPLPLSTFDGRVLLVVNTASLCGFTRQYGGLQALWERYRDEGFVLLGVPSNDFGGQEPGNAAEIKSFC